MDNPADKSAKGARRDRRTERSRAALLAAFRDLLLTRGYDALTGADIAEAANVGRSTFYEHFAGKQGILADSLTGILAPLAAAGTHADEDPRLTGAVQHFWDNRRFARSLLAGEARLAVTRRLAEMIAAALPGEAGLAIPAGLIAPQIAAAQIALIEEWLSGRHGCSADTIARSLQACARAIVTAYRKA